LCWFLPGTGLAGALHRARVVGGRDQGHLPKRIVSLVLEWAFEHRDELMEDWELARAKKPLMWIEPLV